MTRTLSLSVLTMALFALRANSAADEPLQYKKVPIDTADLQAATELDVFRFAISIPKGDSFRVVLREIRNEEDNGKVLFQNEFSVDREDDVSIRFIFLRRDRTLGGVLASDEPDAVLRLDCSGGTSGGLVTIVSLPLREIKSTERILRFFPSRKWASDAEPDVARLMTLEPKGSSRDVRKYPFAELVVERAK